MEFSIYETSLFDGFLNELHFILSHFNCEEELRGIRRNINNIFYGINIYFCFSKFKNRKNILIIDKEKTIKNIHDNFLFKKTTLIGNFS